MIPQNVYWGSGSVTPEEGQTTSVKVFNPEIEGDEGILHTVKNTEETSLTVNPPTSNARWDLGDMKTGLVYQYDMSKNPLIPVAGSNTKPAVTHGTELTDGAVANTKVLELDYERWIDVPFDTALNSCTLNPARCLRVDDRKGRLAAGYDADLVVITDSYDVVQTYCRGVGML